MSDYKFYAVQPPTDNVGTGNVGSIITVNVIVVPIIDGKEPEEISSETGCYYGSLSGVVENILTTPFKDKGLFFFREGIVVEWDKEKSKQLDVKIPHAPHKTLDEILKDVHDKASKKDEPNALQKVVDVAKNLTPDLKFKSK